MIGGAQNVILRGPKYLRQDVRRIRALRACRATNRTRANSAKTLDGSIQQPGIVIIIYYVYRQQVVSVAVREPSSSIYRYVFTRNRSQTIKHFDIIHTTINISHSVRCLFYVSILYRIRYLLID